MRGASPQDIGHQIMTQIQPKIVSLPAFFQTCGVGDETIKSKDYHIFNEHSFTTERLVQCSFKRRLTFKEEPGLEATKG